MLELLRPSLIIARRETRDQFRDWRIVLPIIILTIFFPYLMEFTAREAVSFVSRYGATIIAERFVPFLLMVVGFFPISFSLVIALESFVGEKERGSIEPLLNTPLADWQLYLGKLLSSTVSPLLGSFLGMSVYLIGLYKEGIRLPETGLIIQIFALITVQAIMMVSGAVVVSTQATSVRAANLLASFIVIPSALLIQGEAIVMFWGDYAALWWIVVGLLLLSILLTRVGVVQFSREELLGREIDVLNFHWGWNIFYRSFKGGAKNIFGWYKDIWQTIRRLSIPIIIMSTLVILSVFIGASQTDRFVFSLESLGMNDMDNRIGTLIETWPVFNFLPVMAIFWQNLRVLILSLFLGMISFGILGVLPVMFSIGVAGYLMQLLAFNGLSPWLYFFAFILPHGVVEIPAAIIACAAVIRMGAILAKPTPGKSINEIWLCALADWVKVTVGIVVPLLFLAAMIEAWVTPRLVLWLL